MATKGKLDDVPTPRVREFEAQFYRFLETEHPDVLVKLAQTATLDDEISSGLDAAVDAFRQSFLA